MKKIFTLIFSAVYALVSMFVGTGTRTAETLAAADSNSITYMLCGYDDASGNTDVIVLANYNYARNSISFIQIPRDTYYEGAYLSRINSIYPSEMASGKEGIDSIKALRTALSSALGIRIDASIGCSMDTFVRLIDAIGGITINLPMPLAVTVGDPARRVDFAVGDNLLDGQLALAFVRARQEYLNGDIGRTDAQKLFLSAFMHKLKCDVGVTEIIKACIATGDGWTIDAKMGTLFKIIAKNRGRLSNIYTLYVNLPGEQAAGDSGDWHYYVAREAAVSLFNMLEIEMVTPFDPDGLLCNTASDELTAIYNSRTIEPRIYDDSTLGAIGIPTR